MKEERPRRRPLSVCVNSQLQTSSKAGVGGGRMREREREESRRTRRIGTLEVPDFISCLLSNRQQAALSLCLSLYMSASFYLPLQLSYLKGIHYSKSRCFYDLQVSHTITYTQYPSNHKRRRHRRPPIRITGLHYLSPI